MQLAEVRNRLKQVAQEDPTLSPSVVFRQVLADMGLDEETSGIELPKFETLVCRHVVCVEYIASLCREALSTARV